MDGVTLPCAQSVNMLYAEHTKASNSKIDLHCMKVTGYHAVR